MAYIEYIQPKTLPDYGLLGIAHTRRVSREELVEDPDARIYPYSVSPACRSKD